MTTRSSSVATPARGSCARRTVGFLVEETEEWVAIALTRNVDGWAETQVIDRRMLVSLRKVRS
jgi:hypothetical protein